MDDLNLDIFLKKCQTDESQGVLAAGSLPGHTGGYTVLPLRLASALSTYPLQGISKSFISILREPSKERVE